MPQEIIETRAVRRVHRQKGILQVPHQQALTFECAANSLTDDPHQAFKRGHGRRRHPAKGQPVARRHISALHLSYENDVDKLFSGTRAVLFEKIIKEQGIQFNEEIGQFFIESAIVDLSRSTFRLGQALTSVSDLTFLNPSRVASTFYDDLYEQILDVVSLEKVHRSFEIPGLAGAQLYQVDFCINGKNSVPLFVIGTRIRTRHAWPRLFWSITS